MRKSGPGQEFPTGSLPGLDFLKKYFIFSEILDFISYICDVCPLSLAFRSSAGNGSGNGGAGYASIYL